MFDARRASVPAAPPRMSGPDPCFRPKSADVEGNKACGKAGRVMLILNAMLAMAFVIMVAILVKDVFDARRAD